VYEVRAIKHFTSTNKLIDTMENITLDKALKIAEEFMNENTIGVEIE